MSVWLRQDSASLKALSTTYTIRNCFHLCSILALDDAHRDSVAYCILWAPPELLISRQECCRSCLICCVRSYGGLCLCVMQACQSPIQQ